MGNGMTDPCFVSCLPDGEKSAIAPPLAIRNPPSKSGSSGLATSHSVVNAVRITKTTTSFRLGLPWD